MGTLSLTDSSEPMLWGHPGQRGCFVHRSETTCDTLGVLNPYQVGSLLSWTLGPTKKQKGIYISAVEVTLASSPCQAWGRKMGRWSGRLGWDCSCLQNSCWFVESPSLLGEAHRLDEDRCLRNGQVSRGPAALP